MNAPPIQTEPLNGLPSWPIGLLAGVEGSGKTAQAIMASASDLIGRTFMVVCGEDTPHDYAAIPGQRVEVVRHDGTYRGMLDAVIAASRQDRVEESKPNLIIFDSGTRLWNLLSESAQESANERARKKNKYVGEDGADIGRDLWNTATSRWNHVIEALREHDGPSIITARLDQQSGTDENTGQPTKEKVWKVQGQKMLPYEVGFIIQMRASYPGSENYLAKVKKWGYEHPTKRGKVEYRALDPDFTVDQLWRNLGLDALVQKRQHAELVVQSESDQTIRRDVLLEEVKAAAIEAGVALQTIADDWSNSHNGQRINATTDIGGLELLRDDLRAQAPQRSPVVQEKLDAVQEQVDNAGPMRTNEGGQTGPTGRNAVAARAASTPPKSRQEQHAELALEEAAFQAEVLNADLNDYCSVFLNTPGDFTSVHLAKATRFLVRARPGVIEALRAKGDATVAEQYAAVGNGFPVQMGHVTGAAVAAEDAPQGQEARA